LAKDTREIDEFITQQKFDDAIEACLNLLETYPRSAILNITLGKCYFELGQIDLAISSYTKATEYWPQSEVSYGMLGQIYSSQGDTEHAIKNLSKAVELKPDDHELNSLLGVELTQNGDVDAVDAVIESFETAINIDPNNAEAYNGIGTVLNEKGELDAAIDSYKQALKIKPDYADACFNMGNALKARGDLDAAIDSYKQALKIKPDFSAAYNNIGNTLKDQDKLEEAIEAYHKALAIKPDFAEAYYNVGLALMYKGDTDEAINSYKRALKIKPGDAKVQHTLAALTGKQTVSAPNDYIESLFDRHAVKFEHSLVDKLEYKFPKIIAEVILKLKSGAELGSVLDLGCGTGLAGVELSGLCQNIEGIDLSKKMLRQASQKNVYDKLSHTGIVEYLSEAALDFDLFIAADVFIYVGELSEVFRLIKSRNKRRGWLAFSTEHTEKEGFFLRASGRYSHSKSYIESLCSEFGYQVLHFSKEDLRKEEGEFLTGGLYVLEF
jgi:predicted TPR repeat methyltransferase